MKDGPKLQMPVRGTWKLVRAPGHARFAFDMLAVDPSTHRRSGASRVRHLLGRARATDWYGWSRPVYAPVDGTVVRAADGSPDRHALSLVKDVAAMLLSRPELNPDDLRSFAGNYIMIEADGYFVFMAHLQEGSLAVAQGDAVRAGQLVGRAGNSGFTLEPHLHVQLLDQIDDLADATAPPFRVKAFDRWCETGWQPVRNGVWRKGEVIRFDEEAP